MLNEENRVAYRCLMARLCVRAGDAEAARANIEEAEALASALSSEFADHALHWANAELHASLGEREEAKSSYQRAVEMPIAIGRGELLLDYGSFLLSLGDRERGKDVLHEAQEETARISRPLERKAKEMIRSLETEVGT